MLNSLKVVTCSSSRYQVFVQLLFMMSGGKRRLDLEVKGVTDWQTRGVDTKIPVSTCHVDQ